MKSKQISKKPLVTVVVPTKNSAVTLDACLESIVKQTYRHIELIVVDNKSSDTTKDIAKVYTTSVFDKGPERSAQRNFGAVKGKGEVLVFIDSDMILSPHIVEECLEVCRDNSFLQSLIIPEESFGEGFWAQCKRLERSFYIGVEWVEAPRFFMREAFEKVHGFDEALCGPEDWDFYQRVLHVYGKRSVGRIHSYIYHNEGRLSLLKTVKKKFYYTKNIGDYKNKLENKERYAQQANGFIRYWVFFRDPLKLFRHPILGVGMLFMKTTEFAFGACGLMVSRLT